MRKRVRLFKTISKKESKPVDICYLDYPDEENFNSETNILFDYEDVSVLICRHLLKEDGEEANYAYGIFEYDKKNKRIKKLSGRLELEEDCITEPNEFASSIKAFTRYKKNSKY